MGILIYLLDFGYLEKYEIPSYYNNIDDIIYFIFYYLMLPINSHKSLNTIPTILTRRLYN